ncbi:replication initiator protein A [Candidatus Acetothermia bacterium]|nr:replication initiator protein A [Candidatus Acetothermia bacterium]
MISETDNIEIDETGQLPIIIPEELELFPESSGSGTQIVRSEVNMLNMPFFLLTNRDGHKDRDTVFELEEHNGDQVIRRSWRVTGSKHLGHPVPYDKKVFRAVEAVIDAQRGPIENPISFTTYELLKMMGEPMGGRQYRRVRESIDRIIATTIIAKNIFFRKKNESWASETFHVYERCLYQGEILPSGQIAESNNLYLHPLYLESLNQRYVKPLDYQYYSSLKRPLAKRLYELLGYKFYGAVRNHSMFLVYSYEKLCQLLPMIPQPHISLAKRCMAPAIEELVETGFLGKAIWRGWKLQFIPGEKAIEEINSALRSDESKFSIPFGE